jgi:hypothetical protein
MILNCSRKLQIDEPTGHDSDVKYDLSFIAMQLNVLVSQSNLTHFTKQVFHV